jgi:hypothetical protein
MLQRSAARCYAVHAATQLPNATCNMPRVRMQHTACNASLETTQHRNGAAAIVAVQRAAQNGADIVLEPVPHWNSSFSSAQIAACGVSPADIGMLASLLSG